VLVVLLVAGIAGGRRVPEFDLRLVAGFAFKFVGVGMSAAKGEIGLRMVEVLFLDGSDILRSPLMFGMAFLAFPWFLKSPVKAMSAIDVLADVSVAVEAERRLCGFIEPLMTHGAVLFPRGMPLDYLAWHESRLDAVGPGFAREESP
jgi:hypothetical protein